MTAAKALKKHRDRRKRQGLTRVEVAVNRKDADLVRNIAKALRDPKEGAVARALIETHFSGETPDFKEYLASAPLEGIDLTRPPDFGRDIDL